jgi:SPP1 gp7 family putative phage head morphogenesis protein
MSVGHSLTGANVEAQRAAKKSAAAMVTHISTETRQALRALVARGIRDGIPPLDLGRLARSMIGMNVQQTHAAMNYRESLINLGHVPSKVDALVDKFVAKKIRERALVIARTETMAALNAGQVQNWNEAKKAGLLGEGAMVEWITTADEETCPVCAPMDGTRVPLGQPFGVPGPPAHPRCRCTIALSPGKKATK